MASVVDAVKLPARIRKLTDDDLGLKLSERLTVQEIPFQKVADDALAATTTSLSLFTANRDMKIVEAWWHPHDTLTADNTDYATIAVKISTTTIASFTTQITGSGDFVVGTPIALTLSATPNIANNDVVLFTIAKAASGVVVPTGHLQLIVCER